MLSFAVFDETGPAMSFELRSAHVCGPDDIVVPGMMEFGDGIIEVEKRVEGVAAFALQFPVRPVESAEFGRLGGGMLMLRTCLLPERPQAYLLSLELARHQMMLLLNKLEEWSLFDRAPDDPVSRLVERAREAFTHALVVQRAAPGDAAAQGPTLEGYTLEADREARLAVDACVAAGEALAIAQARIGHRRRVVGELAAAVGHPEPESAITDHEARLARGQLVASPGVILPDLPKIGCRVNPAQFAPELCERVTAVSEFVCMPMRWVQMEPTEGKYSFAATDRWIEWAVLKARLPVHAGPVLELHPRSVPDFLYIWDNDYETLRDVASEYIKTIVTRYRRTVHTWTIASGLNVGGIFRLTYEQAVDLTRTAVALVRKLHPQGRVQVEVAMPWGEYTGTPRGVRSIAPTLYAQLLNETNTPLDALGVRLQMGQSELGRSARDLLTISAMLDRLASLDRPVSVTVAGVPSKPSGSEGESIEQDLDPGYWGRPWDERVQAEWLSRVARVALSKPYVTSFCWQELVDQPGGIGGEMVGGGLLGPTGVPKPGFHAMQEIRRALVEKRLTLEPI